MQKPLPAAYFFCNLRHTRSPSRKHFSRTVPETPKPRLTQNVHERRLLAPRKLLVRLPQPHDEARPPVPVVAMPEHQVVPLLELSLRQKRLGLSPPQVVLQLLDDDGEVVGVGPQKVAQLAVIDPVWRIFEKSLSPPTLGAGGERFSASMCPCYAFASKRWLGFRGLSSVFLPQRVEEQNKTRGGGAHCSSKRVFDHMVQLPVSSKALISLNSDSTVRLNNKQTEIEIRRAKQTPS